ncbi:MAG: hypothetical protein CO148_07420 [Nitrospirae bacterium CG_4_9_14_3_um_filter_41_27]|nr:PqqD family protein [Nitrospirota bacterium]OIP32122.1 MAG: hypothetical protein AUK23_05225 [Deltaproteobacteria bacterium CG2_30_43_15]PIQ93426.1 MAG: hypothetical protein COV68_09910 [Nitrospirae bacterium CG11_big_fil_rev_8_21_14_0_20_41_14]PIV44306.1 MAG: hypothetical protein COS27_02195 [Nitrospirae bacterium CG02_land_8_20_14_3_00_41_53]PIW86593.1 MAG: hypothetical protein COZ94_09560 [Nitrospirae bacterium CG_4_8_14_3_um_filter_41_47]PJA79473.1 MAG: hypothetical protein CO148_07420 
MENKRNPMRKQDLVWREVDGEVVILTSDNKLMHVLNDVGSRIWTLLDGEHDLAAIAAIISTEYGEAEDTIKKDLVEHLEKLRQLNLLEE